MSIATRVEALDAGMACHVAVPAGGRGPGVLVLQEIFGVNDYIRGRCETLAGFGYVAMAPDLYWRLEPGGETAQDGAARQRAFGYMQRREEPRAVADAGEALDRL